MTLYLIAHKVRGEAALDVAEQMQMADGLWWIIPTSGHRAYPYWFAALDGASMLPDLEMPADLRDHYEVSATPPRPQNTDRATSPRTITPKLEDI